MTSWASIAKAAPSAAKNEPKGSTSGSRFLVVDANAIIGGLNYQLLTEVDKLVTIPDVLKEVRDKQSRHFLANFPVQIEEREPGEDSNAFVLQFARETGDIHALSAVDIKLLALAHTLEVSAYGDSHLRRQAIRPHTQARCKKGGPALPGWGKVSNPEDWKVVDDANDDDDAKRSGNSRITSKIMELSLGAEPQSEAPAQQGVSALLTAGASEAPQPVPVPAELGTMTNAPASTAHEQAVEGRTQGQPQAQEMAEEEVDEDEDDGWEVAASSRGASRHRRRKERKYIERVAARWEAASTVQSTDAASTRAPSTQVGSTVGTKSVKKSDPPSVGRQEGANEVQMVGATSTSEPRSSAATKIVKESDLPSVAANSMETSVTEEAASSAGTKGEDVRMEGGEEGGHEDDMVLDDKEKGVDEEDEDGGEEEEEDEEGEENEGDEGEEEDEMELLESSSHHIASEVGGESAGASSWGPLPLNSTSNVMVLTADFAMQNVLLQIGLRLINKDGRQIDRLSTWALRCSACATVVREAGRVFCPRCGNMTLDKVEVRSGPDGTQIFGVRKKHVLRGTKFSLPKPKGGRGAKNPILREDVMLSKMPRKAKKAATGVGGADVTDLLAGGDIGKPQNGKARTGPPVLLTNWKNNPNERKPKRSNRRK